MNVLAVIDTNVLISALLSKHLDAATVQVLDAIFDRKIVPLYHEEIIREYSEVLQRDKFHFSIFETQTVISAVIDNGISIERLNTGEVIADPKDLVFYEVVMAKQQEGALLVTGNTRHFPIRPFIVTPKEMVDVLQKMDSDNNQMQKDSNLLK